MNFCDYTAPAEAARKSTIKRRPKKKPLGLPVGYRWHKCTTPGWETQAAIPEAKEIILGGFKFSDSPAAWWELSPAMLSVVSCARLLRQFYREARWWRIPAGWNRNPEKEGVPIYGPIDTIIVLYGRNFHIAIERYGEEIFGPHPCRLYYRSQQVEGESAWVGICQITAMWHSDERMLAALNCEIRNRDIWQSEATATTAVLK